MTSGSKGCSSGSRSRRGFLHPLGPLVWDRSPCPAVRPLQPWGECPAPTRCVRGPSGTACKDTGLGVELSVQVGGGSPCLSLVPALLAPLSFCPSSQAGLASPTSSEPVFSLCVSSLALPQLPELLNCLLYASALFAFCRLWCWDPPLSPLSFLAPSSLPPSIHQCLSRRTVQLRFDGRFLPTPSSLQNQNGHSS